MSRSKLLVSGQTIPYMKTSHPLFCTHYKQWDTVSREHVCTCLYMQIRLGEGRGISTRCMGGRGKGC